MFGIDKVMRDKVQINDNHGNIYFDMNSTMKNAVGIGIVISIGMALGFVFYKKHRSKSSKDTIQMSFTYSNSTIDSEWSS